jgi:hypothetical protein
MVVTCTVRMDDGLFRCRNGTTGDPEDLNLQ